jgi:2,4-dienoyl-CoA reductase-like NADH-dependent reductase (Old Yellow Enzyme family)/NADPH-dependent 2,4-dienoyl-CoA reductase/sulfur reductase-like enzyme
MMTAHGGLDAERQVRYYEDRAAGGVGLMCVPGASLGVYGYAPAVGRFQSAAAADAGGVLPDPASAEGIAYFDAKVIPALRALAQAGHRHGAVVLSQIYHLGSGRGSGDLHPTVAPSAIRDEEDRTVPHALDEHEIADLVLAFGHAARRAREAGMDGIELHGAHGYLINEFLSPYTNRRTDRYGGTLENRVRFLREVIASVDQLAGSDFPVGLRVNGPEPAEGGLEIQDVIEIVGAVAPRLIYVNVSGGNTTGLMHGVQPAYASPWLVPAGHNVAFASAVRRAVSLPVIVAGRILDPAQADQLIADGCCDIIGMARGLLADPEWPNKARLGRAADIRPCISTNECHGRGRMICAVNPSATREQEMVLDPATTPRRVLVVGAGPAGTEAAIVAARRGHEVLLCEREETLGGQARLMSLDPGHVQLRRWLEYTEHLLSRTGVEIRCSTEVTTEFAQRWAPEAVILATGARPSVPAIPGVTAQHVVTAESVLRGTAEVGKRVAVVGGLEDEVRPLSTALLLSTRGHDVTLVSELFSIGIGIERRTLHQLLKHLLDNDVALRPMTAVTAIADSGLQTRHTVTNHAGVLDDIDTVVLACGGEAVDDLRPGLIAAGHELHLIGDCVSPRRLVHAILDGARAGRAI